MGFQNKQTLIVGGSSGMGLEAGRLLVEEGAPVTLVGPPGGRRNWMMHAKRSIPPTMSTRSDATSRAGRMSID